MSCDHCKEVETYTMPTELFTAGEKVLIRTVTHYHVGKVLGMLEGFVFLTDSSWVQDTGRWHTALTNGFPDNAEIEPQPKIVRVAVNAIVDVVSWDFDLPKEQK